MMRTISCFSIFVATCCFPLSGYVAAAENRIAPSYTMEEIYERAASLKQLLSKDKLPDEKAALYDLSMKAAEFRGYVAGTLDQQEAEQDLVECSKRNSLTVIAARTAAVLTSTSLNRGGPAGLAVLVAIHFACDDLNGKKK